MAPHGASRRPRAGEAESDAFIRGSGGDLDDYRMVRPDGRIVWVRDRAYADRDDEGRVVFEHGLLFDVTELKEAEAEIALMAYHDGLTGLANRGLFEETLTLAVERAKRDGTVVAVLYFDLDNFKLVNDSLGHHTGDSDDPSWPIVSARARATPIWWHVRAATSS